MTETSCLCSLLLCCLAGQADDRVFSGPQAGEKAPAFKVYGYNGPQAGKEFELLADPTGPPTLLVFVHEVTRPTFQLLRPVDHFANQWRANGLATHFVWLTADQGKTEEFLKRAEKSLSVKSPISISKDGLEGPGNYGLNRKVTLTILAIKQGKVAANFAIVQPNETDAPKVLAAVAKMVGQPAPKPTELAALTPRRQTDRAMPQRDAALQGLMRRMIQMDNDEAKIKEITQAMTKWAGEDAKKKAELLDYCKLIVKLGYGNDLAKAQLKKLAGE